MKLIPEEGQFTYVVPSEYNPTAIHYELENPGGGSDANYE